MGDPIINKSNSPNGTIRSIIIVINFDSLGERKVQMHIEAQVLKQVSHRAVHNSDVIDILGRTSPSSSSNWLQVVHQGPQKE